MGRYAVAIYVAITAAWCVELFYVLTVEPEGTWLRERAGGLTDDEMVIVSTMNRGGPPPTWLIAVLAVCAAVPLMLTLTVVVRMAWSALARWLRPPPDHVWYEPRYPGPLVANERAVDERPAVRDRRPADTRDRGLRARR